MRGGLDVGKTERMSEGGGLDSYKARKGGGILCGEEREKMNFK